MVLVTTSWAVHPDGVAHDSAATASHPIVQDVFAREDAPVRTAEAAAAEQAEALEAEAAAARAAALRSYEDLLESLHAQYGAPHPQLRAARPSKPASANPHPEPRAYPRQGTSSRQRSYSAPTCVGESSRPRSSSSRSVARRKRLLMRPRPRRRTPIGALRPNAAAS